MSKGANIYWDSPHRTASRKPVAVKRRRRAPEARTRTSPRWLTGLIFTSIFVMLCVSINFRAIANARDEVAENDQLATRIQNLQDENLALQEEIHTLKTDPIVIAREARRLGVYLQPNQVPVPVD